jgi:hypothetical protein
MMCSGQYLKAGFIFSITHVSLNRCHNHAEYLILNISTSFSICLFTSIVYLMLLSAGFEVLMEASMKMAVFWVVTLCILVEVYQHFRVTCCLHHQGSLITLMMEAASTSESLVNFYQTTWCYNPEDSHLQ